MSATFIYTPTSGSRIFGMSFSLNQILMVMWENKSFHITGARTTVQFQAASAAWRAAARKLIVDLLPQMAMDIVAWDERGAITIAAAGNGPMLVQLIEQLRKLSELYGGPSWDTVPAQLMVSPEFSATMDNGEIGVLPLSDPTEGQPVSWSEPHVTALAMTDEFGDPFWKWVIMWNGFTIIGGPPLGDPTIINNALRYYRDGSTVQTQAGFWCYGCPMVPTTNGRVIEDVGDEEATYEA